jgi:hypothetical protein
VLEEVASWIDAMDGDFRRLEARLRKGVILTERERELLANRGNRKRPPHRPTSSRRQLKRGYVRAFMSLALEEARDEATGRPWSDKKIVLEAMKQYSISRTDAYEILKEVKNLSSG